MVCELEYMNMCPPQLSSLLRHWSPERVESKRESMRNVERFLYVNMNAAENLNKIVANNLLGAITLS